MIALDELLIKIGIDGSQAQQINTYVNMLQNGADSIGANASAINSKIDGLLNDVSQSLDNASEAANKASNDLEKSGASADKAQSKFSKLKIAMVALVGGALLFGGRIASAFNSAINNAEELFKSKNALYSISQDEIAQVKEYKQSLDKTTLSIDSIRTKIAINLIPSVMAVSEGFNGWLVSNKDLITNGISKVIEWLGKGVQLITNFIKFIDKIVTSTIGWKNTFIALGVAWAILNKAFLFSPIGRMIAYFGVLILLVDDLMTYMEGGKSLFGEYWNPLISGGQKVIDFFQTGEKIWKPILIFLLTYIGLIGANKWHAGTTKGISTVGKAFKGLRALVVGHPVLAIIAAIATAAYLIYDNWDWLSAQFKKIWSNISGFATEAWNTIVSTVSDAIKSVLMYFGMSEKSADSTVKAIGAYFGLIFDLISLPFKTAYDFVSSLFDIWGNDNDSFTDKVGKTFDKVTDLITSPFKTAMKWIEDTFMGFIKSTLGWVEKGLSKVGIDVDLTGKDANKPPPQEFSRHFANAGLVSPNVPNPSNADNRVVNNNQEYKTDIIINTTDTADGVKSGLSSMERQIEKVGNNSKSSFGSM